MSSHRHVSLFSRFITSGYVFISTGTIGLHLSCSWAHRALGINLKLKLSFSSIQQYLLSASYMPSTMEGLARDEKNSLCLNLQGVHILMGKNEYVVHCPSWPFISLLQNVLNFSITLPPWHSVSPNTLALFYLEVASYVTWTPSFIYSILT